VQLTVNQLVPGSIPGRGASFWAVSDSGSTGVLQVLSESSILSRSTRINWIDESKIVNASHRGHLVTHAGIPAMKRRGKSPHLRCA
jgi:hypothetical protein